jgi:two-component system response regulator WspF
MKIGIMCGQPTMAECLRGAVTQAPEHQVTWTAANWAEAVDRCGAEAPDLVLMVVRTMGIDVVDATRRIMSTNPCPILLVTVDEGAHVGSIFEAMGHGALDVVNLPALTSSAPQGSTALLLKKITTIARLMGDRNGIRQRPPSITPKAVSSRCDRLVAIGASAGGPAALAVILAGLPKDLPAAVVIVQHVDAQFTAGMTQWLSDQTGLHVRVAKEGDRLVQGGVFMAGTSDHLVLEGADCLTYTREPLHHAYRPSIDVLFESVSRQWRGKVVGVLLTGMGKDGARGLKLLRDRGHHTIAQDEATSSVYGMPKAAVALNAAVEILPMRRIAPRLLDLITPLPSRGAKQPAGSTP